METNNPATEEVRRIEVLHEYGLLDTASESQFDDFTLLAASACMTPMAVICLIDKQRQWFKSSLGLEFRESARQLALCEETIQQSGLLQIEDTLQDARSKNNPMVINPPGVRFYAGVPLETREGYKIGTLAVMDIRPRTLLAEQQQSLIALARELMVRFELRREVLKLERKLMNTPDTSDTPVEATADKRQMLQAVIDEQGAEARLSQAFINSLPGVFYVFDAEGLFLRWNWNLEQVTGYAHDEMAHAHPLDLLGAPEEKTYVQSQIARVYAEGSATLEANLLTRDGRRIPYYFTGTRIEIGERFFVCGMGIDITERRRSEDTLRLRNRAIEASVNAIIITNLLGEIEYANPAFETITGYQQSEVVHRYFDFLYGRDHEQQGVRQIANALQKQTEGKALLRNYRRDGKLFWNDFHIAPVRNAAGMVTHFVGVLNDVTSLKRYEAQLEHQANYDELTRLPNRSVLKDRIRHALALAQRRQLGVTVGFMDLDNFKFVNDSLGHTIGDELLKRVADRLSICLRSEDTVARYGGDEFAFVLNDTSSEQPIGSLMERVLKAVDRPFHIQGHEFYISCSIGLAIFPKDGTDVDTLLRNADTAMYRAKERGRNNYQFYTPMMNQRVTERLQLEAKLRQALANEEFALHYQPKVDLGTGRIVGIEALLRWKTASGENISPATFIPLAEETGLIVPIGEWVLHTACMHNKRLQENGLPPIHVAVNISARQFDCKTLGASIHQALTHSGLDSRYLELELTESLVMENPEEVIGVLQTLREMGLRMAIDDFGTGYSSLSYLQRFPIDRLKIDQSFVRDIGADPNDAIIARAVISLGHSLGMSVIAEGVSNHEQLAFLRENGCDEMQGYLYSRPLPYSELLSLMRENRFLT